MIEVLDLEDILFHIYEENLVHKVKNYVNLPHIRLFHKFRDFGEFEKMVPERAGNGKEQNALAASS